MSNKCPLCNKKYGEYREEFKINNKSIELRNHRFEFVCGICGQKACSLCMKFYYSHVTSYDDSYMSSQSFYCCPSCWEKGSDIYKQILGIEDEIEKLDNKISKLENKWKKICKEGTKHEI